MRKRILSLVLAIAMCFSMVSVVVANDEAELLERSELTDLIENYRDRVWDWQEGQFEAMTDEQWDVINDSWASYEANKDQIAAIAEELAVTLISDEFIDKGLADAANGDDGTLKNLYKWKAMRDLMEGRLDATSNDDAYATWFDAFVAFEEANDEAVSAKAPVAALNGLKEYSSDLTVFFGELARLGVTFVGEDAGKLELYFAAFEAEMAEQDYPDAEAFKAALKADAIELAVEGMVNSFEVGMQVATGKLERGCDLFGQIPDRDFKGGFLLLGEDFVRYLVNNITPMRDDLLDMNKKDFIEAVLAYTEDGVDAKVTDLILGDNAKTSEALYFTAKAIALHVLEQEFCDELESKVSDYYSLVAEDVVTETISAIKEAMDVIDANHGLELVHFNTYVGRAMLHYDNEGELYHLADAVIDVDATSEITLGFAHNKYPAFEEALNGIQLAQFDVEGSENGITVTAADEIGVLLVEVADDANGEVTVNVFRGYTDEDVDGVDDYAEDVYRYVTSFKVVYEAPYVDLDEIKDPSVDDGKVVVKGETNLDEVDVVIKDKDGNVIYDETHTKEELEEGIEIELPDDIEIGDEFTVEVTKPDEDDVMDSDDFTVVDGPYVDLDEIEDPSVDDGKVVVKGETNLDEVDVVIKDKDGNVIYDETHTKEELEEGIEIELPDDIEEGDDFTVEVTKPGEDDVLDSDTVTVVSGYYVELEDVLDTTVDGTITVKGETNLDYVTVAIIKNGETIYAVVYSEAEFEAGIVLNAPDNAVEGEVYTVVVGTEKASDSDEFAIEGAVSEYYVELEDVADTTVDGTITVKGETNLDYVTVAIVKDGETIYAVVYEKAEFEAGIVLNAPDNAAIGDVYTVVVGTEKAADSDEFAITGVYVNLEDVQDPTLDGEVIIKGETNLDEVDVVIKDKDGNVIYDETHTKEELEEGIEIELPGDIEIGDEFVVEITKPGDDEVLDSDDFTVVDGPYVDLEDVLDTTVDGTITIKGTTNLENVTVSIVKGSENIYAVVYTKAEFEAGITLNVPDGAVIGDVYTVAVGTEEASDEDDFTVIGDYVILDEIEDPSVDDGKVVVKGETNLDEVDVVIKDKDGNVIYDETHTKEELEEGIEIELPDDIKPGDEFTVEVTKPGEDDVLDSDTVTVTGVKGKLSLAGSTTRTASVGGTVTITTTPQDIYPEDATVTVVWTTETGEIIEVTSTAGEFGNIATITKLAKGTEKVTATLYVNGIAVDSKTVTIKNKSVGGGDGPDKSYTSITVKVDETKDVTKAPTNGTNVEFIPESGNGKVTVEIVDGVITVTGVTEGVVKGQLVIRNEAGRVVSTLYYEFVVTEGDSRPDGHKCEWPDIAATATKGAHWAHLTIDIMTINGYIKGYPDGTFKPDNLITRAEFSAIVYRILGLQEAEDGVHYDDTVGHWAEDLIATMSLPEGYGMLRGYGDGNFGPNDYITREQAVAIIARAKSAVWVEAEEGAKDVFTDAEDISWWFDGEMDAAVTNGLIQGYEDGSYRPLNNTTRAEACVLLARAWPEVLE